MSYEIVIFDAEAAPTDDDDAFVEWYTRQTTPSDDPDVGTVAMRNWYSDFSSDFPAANGPYADAHDGNTYYEFGPTITRATVPVELGKRAADSARSLAGKDSVGFFNPNADELRLFFP